MKKLLVIGWKDLRVAFRDKAAIIMLAAPFALTLAMGAITGNLSGDGETGLQNIPVVVVDQDGGALAVALVDVLQAGEEGLFAVDASLNEREAKERVEADEVAAAVIIEPGFTDGLLSPEGGAAAVEIYVNPARTITAGVVRSVVEGFVNELETRVVTAQVAVSQLIARGVITPQEAEQVGEEIGLQFESSLAPITITTGAPVEEEDTFNPLAMLAPGMAVLFLMYTVSSVGGRSIVAEGEERTMQRMLSTPSSTTQVLGGKVFGVFLTGAAQMGIVILASSLLFQLSWGDPVAVIALVLAAVVGASGWGILLAAFAKTPTQVSNIGTALMLLFGILGGSFSGGASFSGLLGTIGKITPNAWALDGFVELARGGGLADILIPIVALLIMGLVLFGVAVWAFRRYGLTKR